MAAATWTKSGLTSTGRWLLASTGYPVDEVTNIENDVEYDYYCSIYSHIKSHMQNKNSCHELRPPQGDRKDDNVSIADIISSEEEWVYHRQMPWKSRYRPSDFMGVSNKEYPAASASAKQTP